MDTWTTIYPPGHDQEGEAVEVVPRAALSEAVTRFEQKPADEEVEDAKERAARAVERACAELGSGDPVRETAATDLRTAVLRLTELASR